MPLEAAGGAGWKEAGLLERGTFLRPDALKDTNDLEVREQKIRTGQNKLGLVAVATSWKQTVKYLQVQRARTKLPRMQIWCAIHPLDTPPPPPSLHTHTL